MSEIQSMTGFGGAENGVFSVEVRSVNHRYFDVIFRMPYFINRYEIELRKRLKDVFSRGRFEVNISVSPEKVSDIRVNEKLVAGIIESLKEIKKKFSVKGEIELALLTGFRDIVITENSSFDDDVLIQVFDQAVSRLYEMRVSEGSYIKGDLSEILKKIEIYVNDISNRSEGIIEKLRQRFTDRFNDLISNNPLDENRLLQEVLIMAERADISEELTRLKSHIKQFETIISTGGVIGRKLDFLLQEFLREANTIASKTSEYDIVSTIIDLKNEIEKLREQVQNIQ
ncbi:hypothetical protein BMS3Bbin05_01998 [bacterium BMS3Bbin05]|nr:hypothetical protein BMS3Bbin05_01998 [bacterium BMS3Bbin05]HDL20264.1 YicC family protein [Nitrospirota bacterium]HDO22968.1 YicC family protein [Nitrospirota bacterium]